jgi:predicted N-acetyltransferase YhbS
MRIRPFTRDDANQASQLILTCLTQVISKDYDDHVIEHVRAQYTPKDLVEKATLGPMIVAEIDGRIVGTARLEGDTIFTVYVDPSMHRNRIGSKLMEEIEHIASDRKLSSVKVEAFVSSAGFYTRLGYEQVKTMKVEGFDVIELRKEL